VVKSAAVAPEMMVHAGQARVFEKEESALEAILSGAIVPGAAPEGVTTGVTGGDASGGP
jgi:dihydroxyacid dehydratase/phosphogluconate dehydratase